VENHYNSYVIKNVTIWNSDSIQKDHNILVQDGTIVSIEPSTPKGQLDSKTTVVDGGGFVVMPLGVDPQVHLRVPGQPQKETPETGLKAALRGGIGALLTMPNTNPIIDCPAAVAIAMNALESASADIGVEVKISAAISVGQKGLEAVNFDDLVRSGVVAFTDDGLGVESDNLMRQAFAASEKHQVPILQHAEVPGHGGFLAPGPLQQSLGSTPYPAEAESDMVARDLKILCEFPKAIYHVLHVSSRKTLGLIDEAKKKGLSVSCEVSPHHLFFTSEELDANNTAFKMNPPLRGIEDREALQQGLSDGRIAFVATDHAPHEAEAKGRGYPSAPFGTTGLETSLRVLLTLCQQGKLSSQRLVEVFSTTPAKFLGIDDRFGAIRVGKPMKAVWVDAAAKPTIIKASDLFSRSQNNCFLGASLSGHLLGAFNGRKVSVF
jgi:dihydroorotase